MSFASMIEVDILLAQLAKSMVRCACAAKKMRHHYQVGTVSFHKWGYGKTYSAVAAVQFLDEVDGEEYNEEFYLTPRGDVFAMTYWGDVGYNCAEPTFYRVNLKKEEFFELAQQAMAYKGQKEMEEREKHLGAGI
jgi:hypothetical protein